MDFMGAASKKIEKFFVGCIRCFFCRHDALWPLGTRCPVHDSGIQIWPGLRAARLSPTVIVMRNLPKNPSPRNVFSTMLGSFFLATRVSSWRNEERIHDIIFLKQGKAAHYICLKNSDETHLPKLLRIKVALFLSGDLLFAIFRTAFICCFFSG